MDVEMGGCNFNFNLKLSREENSSRSDYKNDECNIRDVRQCEMRLLWAFQFAQSA